MNPLKKSFLIVLLFSIASSLAAPPDLYPNFPLTVATSSIDIIPWFGSVLGEVDTLPGLEIVLHVEDGFLHVWNYQGNYLNGFPKAETPFAFSGSTVGDLDGDGENEIVNLTTDGWLDVVDNQGNSWPNFPLATSIQGASPPVLADLDNDGQKEIILYDIWSKGIYLYNSDGTYYPNWPKFINSGYAGFNRGIPAVGDVDGDGFKEIVACGTDSIYVWKGTGESLQGWPRAAIDTIPTIYNDDSPPVLVDLDKDGKLEIVVARLAVKDVHDWPFDGGVIEVYNSKAEILPGWPRDLTGAVFGGPIVGDLDKDGSIEIVVHSWDHINILKSNGEFYPGWPIEVNYLGQHQPVLVDLDEDDSLEIVLVANGTYIWGTKVFAYSLSGNLLAGYPLDIDGTPSLNSPAIGDADNSDTSSLLIVTEGASGKPNEHLAFVYLFDLGVPYDPSSVQWGTYGHNNRRTNNYHDSDICNAKPGDANGDTVVGFSDIIKIIDYLFRSDTLSTPKCAYDPSFDRKIRLSDAVYLINYLFKDGIPPIPYDDCCIGN